ncbi:helix-turn-helix transcriptional regulator [Gulosibacter bifidus]|uniref:Helix-turn-helix transcriptional regulator n=1 Tax=Gulosibacter bifidus TaxID=272239 RepID=A0ABW5RJG0_9MICO|nr:helix-turn-helix domain-containing protein [Gulosibacter bifidus]
MDIFRNGERLLTIQDLAQRMQVSTSTLYRWRSEGTPLPPSIRIGKSIRWRESDVAQWIADKNVEVAA